MKDYILIKDPACGGNQLVQLFAADSKSNETKYCDVDMLLLPNGNISVVIEIEESNVLPTQICG